MTRWGSPNAGDETAEREKEVIEMSEERKERLDGLDATLNRPLGSIVDLSPEERIADWEAKVADPLTLMQEAEQRAQSVGPERAGLELLEWDKSMRELMEKQNA